MSSLADDRLAAYFNSKIASLAARYIGPSNHLPTGTIVGDRGMELTLLDTGCPQVDTERYGPASLVRHDGFTFLVDCGSGVT